MVQTAPGNKPAAASPQAGRIAQLCQQGVKAMNRGDWAKAAKSYQQAWELEPENKDLLALVASVLVKQGARDKAIAVLEKALEIVGPTKDILKIIGRMALDMSMYDIAEKLFGIYTENFPGEVLGYMSLAKALGGLEEFDRSITLLQEIIPIFPEEANLWNLLATHVSLRDGDRNSLVFYDEAWRLNPRDFSIASNISRIWERLAEIEKSTEWAAKALKLAPGDPEPRFALGVCQLTAGYLQKGWKNYAARHDERRRIPVIRYTHELKPWRGKNADKKSIFVASEQGVGDEMLFGLAIPRLYEQARELHIGCDPRLVSVFERSFPEARVWHHGTVELYGEHYRSYPELERALKSGDVTIDGAIEAGSLAALYWQSLEDMPSFADGYLALDETRVAHWRERLAALSARPKIGIGWKSANMSAARIHGYLPIDDMASIFAVDDVDFINVQYGDCGEEIAHISEKFGVTLQDWNDLDLKNDFEGTLAMMKNLDLIIAPATAPAMMGMAVGTPVWWQERRLPWWNFGSGRVPFFSKGSIMIAGVETPWAEHTPRVAERLTRAISAKDFTTD